MQIESGHFVNDWSKAAPNPNQVTGMRKGAVRISLIVRLQLRWSPFDLPASGQAVDFVQVCGALAVDLLQQLVSSC